MSCRHIMRKLSPFSRTEADRYLFYFADRRFSGFILSLKQYLCVVVTW
jgi:hypothetical protein